VSRPSAGLSFADAASRRRLRWLAARDDARTGRSSPALRNGGLAIIELERETAVLAKPATDDDIRPRAASREPCPQCGARGDLGCDHFAPCEATDLPHEGQGLLLEKPGAGARCRRFTADEDRQILELTRQGLPMGEIAARLGRHRGSVFHRLEMLHRD
jgi:hypothetical protein